MSKILSRLQKERSGENKFVKTAASSFTLVEMLVVIGILAVLTAAVFLVINPVEYLKQARDTTRMSDLDSIDKALAVLETQGITSFGTDNTVYVSVPDISDTCANLGLPALPSGWSYHCVSSTNLQKVDSNGWIPVNFASSPALAFSALPLDPVNTTSTGNYYTYVTGGSWELTTELESSKHQTNAINDGDAFPGVYSIRSSATPLTPGIRDKGLVGYWTFEEGSGSSVPDRSGNSNTGTWNGTGPTHYATGKVGSYAGQFNGTDDYVNAGNQATLKNITNAVSVMAWVKGSIGSGYQEIIVRYVSWGLTPLEGVLKFYVSSNGESWNLVFALGTKVINDNVWHHVIGVYDGAQGCVYVDGSLDACGGIPGSIYIVDADTIIGGLYWAGHHLSGLIDDVRVYNRALSASEIQAIYNATK